MERRGFLKSTLTYASWGIMTGLAFVPGLGHLLSPVLRKINLNEEWYPLGALEDFTEDSTSIRTLELTIRDGWEQRIQKQIVFIVIQRGTPRVFSSVCPHLSCPVNFDDDAQQFHCPCHQSFWKTDGERLSGPSPRNLDSLPTQVKDGELFCRWVNYRPNLPTAVEV